MKRSADIDAYDADVVHKRARHAGADADADATMGDLPSELFAELLAHDAIADFEAVFFALASKQLYGTLTAEGLVRFADWRMSRLLDAAILRGTDAQVVYCLDELKIAPTHHTMLALATSGRFLTYAPTLDPQRVRKLPLPLPGDIARLYLANHHTRADCLSVLARMLKFLRRMGAHIEWLYDDSLIYAVGYYAPGGGLDWMKTVVAKARQTHWLTQVQALVSGIVASGDTDAYDTLLLEVPHPPAVTSAALFEVAKKGYVDMCRRVVAVDPHIEAVTALYEGAFRGGQPHVLAFLNQTFPMRTLRAVFSTLNGMQYYDALRSCHTPTLDWIERSGVALTDNHNTLLAGNAPYWTRATLQWAMARVKPLCGPASVPALATILVELYNRGIPTTLDGDALTFLVEQGDAPSLLDLFHLLGVVHTNQSAIDATTPDYERLRSLDSLLYLKPPLDRLKQATRDARVLAQRWVDEKRVPTGSSSLRTLNTYRATSNDTWAAFMQKNKTFFDACVD